MFVVTNAAMDILDMLMHLDIRSCRSMTNKTYVITEDELRYLVDGFVYQEHETTLRINSLVRSRLIEHSWREQSIQACLAPCYNSCDYKGDTYRRISNIDPHSDKTTAIDALDELYKFVDGLDPDFIIRERISIIKSRIKDPRYQMKR